MLLDTLPILAREALTATEERLEAVYRAARLGLKHDALALHAGMLPQEYRRLREMDPLVDLAEAKGRADAEAEAARREAANNNNGGGSKGICHWHV